MAAVLLEDLKKIALQAIDNFSAEMFNLNQSIWSNPELGYQEKSAHKVLTSFLEDKCFDVKKHVGQLVTAFRASSGQCNKRVVGLLCEYDALPGIGHACGHNLIAEAGVGAALGLKAALEASNDELGKIVVLGTPAEEGGGGKVKMLEAGCFDGIDFCLMVHPKSFNCIYPTVLALQDTKVTYHADLYNGSSFVRSSALDAAVLAYSGLSMLRQQLKPSWRLHGVISYGGVSPDIFPEKASLTYYFRAPTEEELKTLCKKAEDCFCAAAQATGCSVDIDWNPVLYSNLATNGPLAQLYQRNAEQLGMQFPSREEQIKASFGSTDMGNVSHVKPSIHPFYSIQTSVANHTREFTEAAGRVEAHVATVIQAKVMAMTALDVLYDEQVWNSVVKDFKRIHGKDQTHDSHFEAIQS